MAGSAATVGLAVGMVALALGVPGGEGGCGGPVDEPAANLPCVEQQGLHQATCVDTDVAGERSCVSNSQASPLKCPAGCTAGATTFSWHDAFGDAVHGVAALDPRGMCALRKAPGLDCTYVEHLPCLPSR